MYAKSVCFCLFLSLPISLFKVFGHVMIHCLLTCLEGEKKTVNDFIGTDLSFYSSGSTLGDGEGLFLYKLSRCPIPEMANAGYFYFATLAHSYCFALLWLLTCFYL